VLIYYKNESGQIGRAKSAHMSRVCHAIFLEMPALWSCMNIDTTERAQEVSQV